MKEEVGNWLKVEAKQRKDESDDIIETHNAGASSSNDEETDSDYGLSHTSVELNSIEEDEKTGSSIQDMSSDATSSSESESSSNMNEASSEQNITSSFYSLNETDGYSNSESSFGDSDTVNTNSYDGSYINFFYGDEASSISETSDLEIVQSISHRNIGAQQTSQPDRGTLNDEDRDLFIVESINNNEESYPRVTHEIIIMVLGKIYWAYYYVISLDDAGRMLRPDQPNNFGIRSLSDILRSFSPAELGFLKNKIRRILISDFRNPSIVELLIDMVDPNKIDEGFQRTILKSVQYKDLINKESKSCIICYENFKKTSMCVSLKCLHIFHSGCIKSWFNKSYSCPVCRTYNI